MGQKTNPIGNRLGFIHGWESNWYGGDNYGDKLVEDDKIRRYLRARLSRASIAKIVIERTLKLVTVTINTARPGVIIGKGGQDFPAEAQSEQAVPGARLHRWQGRQAKCFRGKLIRKSRCLSLVYSNERNSGPLLHRQPCDRLGIDQRW